MFAINFESQTTALKLYLILFFSPSTYFMRGIRRVACTSNHHCQNVSIMDFEIDFRLGGLIYTEKKHTFKQSSFRPHQYTWFLLQGMSEIQFRCRTERRRLDTKKTTTTKSTIRQATEVKPTLSACFACLLDVLQSVSCVPYSIFNETNTNKYTYLRARVNSLAQPFTYTLHALFEVSEYTEQIITWHTLKMIALRFIASHVLHRRLFQVLLKSLC